MSLSLQGSILTCKVDSGQASRLQTDRIFNPNFMLCPVWNGRDLAGREVCADSFYTKNEGCNSALDRVCVENNQRPQYIDYVTLSAEGIMGPPYDSLMQLESADAEKSLYNINKISGNYGLSWRANVNPQCGCTSKNGWNKGCGDSYGQAMQQEQSRMCQAQQNAFQSNQSRCGGP